MVLEVRHDVASKQFERVVPLLGRNPRSARGDQQRSELPDFVSEGLDLFDAVLRRSNDEGEVPDDLPEGNFLVADGVKEMRTAGAAGYGDPIKRDPDEGLEDVRRNLVDRESAYDVSSVVQRLGHYRRSSNEGSPRVHRRRPPRVSNYLREGR